MRTVECLLVGWWMNFHFVATAQNAIPELAYLNTSVNPCENFYEFACGNFKIASPRPERYPLWDGFIKLQEELHQLFSVIFSSEDRKGDAEGVRKARAAYKACIKTEYADNLNYPELDVLETYGSWPLINATKREFSWETMGDIVANFGIQLFLHVDVIEDLMDPSLVTIMIGKDPVLNPSFMGVYEDNSVDFINVNVGMKDRHPFELFLVEVANTLKMKSGSLVSNEVVDEGATQIFEFMKLVQKGGNNTGGLSSAVGFFTVETLQQWIDQHFPDINLGVENYLQRAFSKSGVQIMGTTSVMISSPAVLHSILDLIKSTDEDMLWNFIFARLFTFTAPDSSNMLRNAYEQFRIRMNDTIFTRREYCTRFVLGYPNGIALSMAATLEYQRYHFNHEKLNEMTAMVKQLNKVFLDILNEADWLDQESRGNATAKAKNMITLLGYPNFVGDKNRTNYYYSNVRICLWDHFGNAQRLRAFNLALNYALLNKPRNREVWNKSPLVVNAFYNFQNNRIIIPISILNPVFLTGSHSVLDYARIGAIIGHEITHGFDSQGRLYNQDGVVGQWWSDETIDKFQEKQECFRVQYEKYYIEEIEKYIDPVATMRENLADNGGLKEAYRAFKEFSTPGVRIQGYTSEQLFFIGYGTMWCAQETSQYLEKIAKSNYAPSRFRVIGSVSNNADFAKAFNCASGSSMNPEPKCVLW